MRYAFVSHANQDKARLKPILEALLAAGVPLWIDRPLELGLHGHPMVKPGIRPGRDWDEEINEALEGAACVLFFLSRSSMDPARSDSLFREYDHGAVNRKLVIARVEDIGEEGPHGLVRIRQAVDVSGYVPGVANAQFDGLVTALRAFVLQDGKAAGGPAGPGRSFAPLLPYLCDRRSQRRMFSRALQDEIDRKAFRPQMFFVIGDDNEVGDKFVEQLHVIDLPEILRRNGMGPEVEVGHLYWPSDTRSDTDAAELDDLVEELEFNLAERLKLRPNAGPVGIRGRLDRQSGALFLYFDVNAAKWNPAQAGLLERWIAWWGRLDFATRRHPLVIVGRVCSPSGWSWPFLGRPSNGAILSDLGALAKSAGDGVAVTVLPQLGQVSFEDVDAWVSEHSVFARTATPALRQRVRRFFTGPLRVGERKVPMEEAATFLTQIISEMKIAPEEIHSRRNAS